MIVAFLGNDGSGKSTACRAVHDRLAAAGRRVSIVPGFEHLFAGRLRNAAIRLSGRGSGDVSTEYFRHDEPHKGKANPLYHVSPYLVWIDFLLRIVARLLSSAGRIVIFDRYAYDYAISLQDLGYGGGPIQALLRHVVPRPRHVFVFDASAEVAHARKRDDHDMDLAFYTRQRERYAALAAHGNYPLINTDATSGDTIAERIVGEIIGA